MPLSPDEQRILDEIEQRLAEEDPRLVETVSRSSLSSHLASRIRWSFLAFIAGFVMLMLFPVSAVMIPNRISSLCSVALYATYRGSTCRSGSRIAVNSASPDQLRTAARFGPTSCPAFSTR